MQMGLPSQTKLPASQKAIVARAVGKYGIVYKHPLPASRPSSILVRVSSVALNPANWKMIDATPPIGVVGGNDFSGVVCAVGTKVTAALSVGDKVCGCLYGLDPTLEDGEWAGSFAEYISIDGNLVMRIPTIPGANMSMSDAASLPVGVMTAGMGLYQSLELPMPTVFGEREGNMPSTAQGYVLIHGGNTATGTIAIQLAKLSGMTPVATSSPSNFSKMATLGAIKTFDYNSPSCGTAVRAFTKGKLNHVLDCISDIASMRLCYSALGPKGGKYVSLEPPSRAVAVTRNNVSTDWVMMLAIFGKEVVMDGEFRRAADSKNYEFAVEWFRKAEILLGRKLIVPHQVRILPGGFDAVISGIEELKVGHVKGEKLVCNLVE